MKKVEQNFIKELIKLLDNVNELITEVECEKGIDEPEYGYLDYLYDDLITIEAEISDIVYEEGRIKNHSWYELSESEVE